MNALADKHPRDISFHQLLRFIEVELRGCDPAAGESLELLQERVRISTNDSLGFPPQDVHNLLKAENGDYHMLVNFMGLYGMSSPLPSYFTDPLDRMDERYIALRSFLDIFSNRLYLLYHLAWKRSRVLQLLESGGGSGLIGNLRQWLSRSDPQFGFRGLAHAAQMSRRVRSAQGLEEILRKETGILEVVVVPFTGSWIQHGHGLALGISSLGEGLLGERVQDPNASFRIEIGPLPWRLFRQFLPSGRQPELRPLISAYLGEPLEFSILIRLDPSSVSGEDGALLGVDCQLGHRSWLGSAHREILTIEYEAVEVMHGQC